MGVAWYISGASCIIQEDNNTSHCQDYLRPPRTKGLPVKQETVAADISYCKVVHTHTNEHASLRLISESPLRCAPSSAYPQTPAERKEEMVREFRRWAGYTPCSMRGPGSNGTVLADPSAAETTTTAPPTSAHEGGTVGRRPGRGRRSTAVLLRVESGGGAPAAEAPSGGGRREGAATGSSRALARPPRARSLSSRSAGAAAAAVRAAAGSDSSSAGGGRIAKRNKWSGGAYSAGRATEREREQTSGPGKRAPWGAGPGKGEVRERTQAWANAHLADRTRRSGGYSSVGSGSWRGRVRSRKVRVSASGCGGGHKAGRRAAKSAAAGDGGGGGGRRRTARRRTGGGGGGREEARANPGRSGSRAETGAASALDVTWDVLDAEGYPELTPRRRKELFPVAETEDERPSPLVVRQARGGGGGGARGGRTDRVVDMLASLEKAVMDVCKVGWLTAVSPTFVVCGSAVVFLWCEAVSSRLTRMKGAHELCEMSPAWVGFAGHVVVVVFLLVSSG